MATLSLTLTGFDPAVKTLSAGDLTKLNAAITAKLNQAGVDNPTQQQVFDYIATWFFTNLVQLARQANREKAAAMVTDITLT